MTLNPKGLDREVSDWVPSLVIINLKATTRSMTKGTVLMSIMMAAIPSIEFLFLLWQIFVINSLSIK